MSGVADVQEEARGRLSRLRRATGALLASFNSLISLLRIGDSNMPFVEGARIGLDVGRQRGQPELDVRAAADE